MADDAWKAEQAVLRQNAGGDSAAYTLLFADSALSPSIPLIRQELTHFDAELCTLMATRATLMRLKPLGQNVNARQQRIIASIPSATDRTCIWPSMQSPISSVFLAWLQEHGVIAHGIDPTFVEVGWRGVAATRELPAGTSFVRERCYTPPGTTNPPKCIASKCRAKRLSLKLSSTNC